ncbi:MAG TPA: hypothetical protein PLJ00_16220 [Chitinophagales bacterium]|nr:hypothetical protein [Chitinophagales bacterium]
MAKSTRKNTRVSAATRKRTAAKSNIKAKIKQPSIQQIVEAHVKVAVENAKSAIAMEDFKLRVLKLSRTAVNNARQNVRNAAAISALTTTPFENFDKELSEIEDRICGADTSPNGQSIGYYTYTIDLADEALIRTQEQLSNIIKELL